MSIVRAFVLGTAATAVLAYVLAGALALAVAGSGAEVRLASGPLVLVEVEQRVTGPAVSLGTGLLVVALLGGALNGFAGSLVRRRAGHDRDRVP